MTAHTALTLALYLGLVALVAVPLGEGIAAVMADELGAARAVTRRIEATVLGLAGVRPDEEMSAPRYLRAVLVFNFAGLLAVYALERLQGLLPLDPAGLGGVAPEVAFNTAVSFATNTNWQAYGGETTMSYLTQMCALTVQNFASAATGIAVLFALIRGFTRAESQTVGSFGCGRGSRRSVRRISATSRRRCCSSPPRRRPASRRVGTSSSTTSR